jgi:hypothetical protein
MATSRSERNNSARCSASRTEAARIRVGLLGAGLLVGIVRPEVWSSQVIRRAHREEREGFNHSDRRQDSRGSQDDPDECVLGAGA